MKFLLFSDAHGAVSPIREALELHKSDTDGVLYAGDGIDGFEKLMKQYPEIPYYAVLGNCDCSLFSGAPEERVIPALNHRIFLCHGHKFGVNGGVSTLVRKAEEAGCDIAVYGHTHKAYEEYLSEGYTGGKPFWVFNPGSVSQPRGDGKASYGVLRVMEEGILYSRALTDREL